MKTFSSLSSREIHTGIQQEAKESFLRTGIDRLDQLLYGGVPRGKITQVTGAVSSGKTSLGLSVLAQTTAARELAAYIDTFDALDPLYARRAGVDLRNLLWIRCRKTPQTTEVEQAMKAADILVRGQGFGLILIDLTPFFHQPLRIPSSVWYRLKKVVRGTRTAVLVLSEHSASAGASSSRLSLERRISSWGQRKEIMNGLRRSGFQGIQSGAELRKGKSHGQVQVCCHL